MSDRTEDALRDALRNRGEEIRPIPALPGILHRAGRSRSPSRRWAPAVAIGIASVGLVAGAVVVVGGTGGGPSPAPAPPVAGDPVPDDDGVGESRGESVAVEPGSEIPMAIYSSGSDVGAPFGDVFAGEFPITSSGNVGVDAVNALLQHQSARPEVFCNLWSGLRETPQPVTRVTSVTHTDGVVTVDLGRDVTDPFPGADPVCPVGPQLQQLVHTVTSALRTDDPVLVTVNGEPADAVFGEPVDGPVEPDMSVLAGIRPETPQQGAVFSGPVTVTGESDTFEANVVVRAYQDGRQVAQDIGHGGGYGEFAPYELTLRGLEPGEYTLKTFTGNAASGPEAYAEIMYPVYTDITVE